jgi:uncharacterized protein (TIGR03118 family)
MKLLRLLPTAALTLSMLGAVCYGQHYNQVNLVSSQGTKGDTDLINPWGMSRGSGFPWWLADAGTGLSTIYIGDGTKQGLVVKIPGSTNGSKGTPTGTIFNGNPKVFLIPGKTSAAAAFLFATLEGSISGWNGNTGKSAVIVARGKAGSAYTGLTSATVDGKTYLYAANVALGTVDVFGPGFKPATFPVNTYEPAPFTDDLLPPNYVPYNVQAIGNNIVVTYAYLPPKAFFPEAGLGLGYVDIYSANGYLKMHLEHGDWLNSPWAVALAPTDFGKFSHDLLIGNFADGEGGAADFSGTIAAYDPVSGHFEGLLEDAKGKPLSIQGLWALSPGSVSPANLDAAASPGAAIYFTAGPNGGHQGLFGYITPASSDLTEGNDQ